MILGEAGKGDTVADAFVGEGGRQHRVESSPRGAKLWHTKLADNAAIASKARAAADGDADAAVDLCARRQQPLQHRRMHAKSGASTFEPFSTPLDDRHVPARTHEGGAREEAAKGTADHDRAPHADFRSCEEETFEATMPSLIARRQAVAQVWIAPRAVYAGGALARAGGR